MINGLKNHPRRIFLIDALGACLTAALLGLVLYNLQSMFGMPGKVLMLLSGIAISFAIYSFSCYSKLRDNFRPYIKYIAIVNTLYCVLSAFFVWYNYEGLTTLGVGYFVVEIFVVLVVVVLEWSLMLELEE